MAAQSSAAAEANAAPPAPKSTPKDAMVMAAILKEMGISEYEPRVINQMLEFTYRYITTVLDDARVYSNHAGKKEVDVDDVQLAIQSRLDHSYTNPPPRDFLIEISRQKNRMPLPLIQPKSGLRLPADRYCLTATNYKIKMQKKPQVRTGPALLSRTLSQGSVPPTAAVPSKTPTTVVSVKLPASAAMTASSGQVVIPSSSVVKHALPSGMAASLPGSVVTTAHTQAGKPQVTKLTVISPAAQPTTPANTSATPSASMLTVSALPSMDETMASVQSSLKRKHEDEDDDYDS